MITAIHKVMAAKRDAIKNEEEKGFTLIELLVVVLIIGILAAIAIPVFLGQQNQAKDASAKSDLGNAKIALIAYATNNNGSYTGATTTTLAPYGYVQSTNGGTLGIHLSTTTTGKFCLDETSTANNPFKITDSGGVQTSLCVSGTDY